MQSVKQGGIKYKADSKTVILNEFKSQFPKKICQTQMLLNFLI